MSKKLNSFILPDDIIKDMKDRIKNTRKLGIELGFALCIDKNPNINHDKNPNINHDINHNINHNKKIITKGSECTGEKCSIKAGVCNKNQLQIGNYHTHPRTDPTMSITDMVTGCSESVQCIGSARSNSIVCFIRKTEESKCLEDTSPFEDEEHKILQKGSEIREKLASPRSIVKTGIYNVLKELKQYDDIVFKYNANRIKLLRKHFDRVGI